MSKISTKNQIVVLVGQTSSGKSELAVKLAKKFNGEIISADSRQIYKGLNLGTGKVEGKWRKQKQGSKLSTVFVYKNIPHYCLDYVNPKKQYSVSLFKRDAQKAIDDILKKGKLPILCGGTAHWVDTVVYNQELPDVKPNKKLRADLEKKSSDVLYKRLLKLDPARASNIDKFNKRRLIRALEIIGATGKAVSTLTPHSSPLYPTLWLGIKTDQKSLYKKIETRLKQRLKQGMVKEVARLHSLPPLEEGARRADEGAKMNLSWRRLESFGLEYRFVSLYLQKKLTYEEMFTQLLYAIKHYSKRQTTWWKRNKEINWIKPEIKVAEKLTKQFLSSRNFLRS